MKRRFSSRFKRSPTRTVKLVCFQVSGEYYAIAIHQVEHILPEFNLHGCLESGRSLVKYKDQAIAVFDLSRIFINPPNGKAQARLSSHWCNSCQYLIICIVNGAETTKKNLNSETSDRFAIPVAEMPSILEVPETQLQELPELYRHGTPGSPPAPKAIEKLIHTADHKTVFYLNLNTFIQS
jgi:chemotaxis signal transduction protein